MRQASWYERIVALLGVVLIGLLWAPWYHSLAGVEGAYFNRSVGSPAYAGTFSAWWEPATGWETGTVTSIVVGVFGVVCVLQIVALWRERSPAVALAWTVGLNWAAIVVVVWLLARIIWPPDYALCDWGVWASLITAIGILVTSWLGMQDERTAKAPARDVPIRPIPPASGGASPAG